MGSKFIMAANNFKPFGIGASANVTPQAAYEALAALSTGFQSGTASSAQVNKALRQGSVMASVLAQFIANTSGADVLDNGDVATPLANLLLGLKANTAGSFLQTANNFVEIKNAGAAAVAQALANLGLGTAALRAVGTGTNQIPDMASFLLNGIVSGTYPNGFKLPTGHIIQYGYGSTSGGVFSQNYVIPFPNTVLVLIPIVYSATGIIAIPTANSASRTTAVINVVNASGAAIGSTSVGFLAIGY